MVKRRRDAPLKALGNIGLPPSLPCTRPITRSTKGWSAPSTPILPAKVERKEAPAGVTCPVLNMTQMIFVASRTSASFTIFLSLKHVAMTFSSFTVSPVSRGWSPCGHAWSSSDTAACTLDGVAGLGLLLLLLSGKG